MEAFRRCAQALALLPIYTRKSRCSRARHRGLVASVTAPTLRKRTHAKLPHHHASETVELGASDTRAPYPHSTHVPPARQRRGCRPPLTPSRALRRHRAPPIYHGKSPTECQHGRGDLGLCSLPPSRIFSVKVQQWVHRLHGPGLDKLWLAATSHVKDVRSTCGHDAHQSLCVPEPTSLGLKDNQQRDQAQR
jgi:hypothetical protein